MIRHAAFWFSFSLLALNGLTLHGQTADSKNALLINVGQYLVNEINLGFERRISEIKSLELNAGLIYRNDVLLEAAKDWTNSQYFYEHGFAARVYYRNYRKKSEGSERRDYMAPGLTYQYLYFPNQWFKADSTDDEGYHYRHEIYQHRFRHRIGLQFLWGKVFPLNKMFSIEGYYGIGVRLVLVDRVDLMQRDLWLNTKPVHLFYFKEEHSYVRPSIHAGIKLKAGW